MSASQGPLHSVTELQVADLNFAAHFAANHRVPWQHATSRLVMWYACSSLNTLVVPHNVAKRIVGLLVVVAYLDHAAVLVDFAYVDAGLEGNDQVGRGGPVSTLGAWQPVKS